MIGASVRYKLKSERLEELAAAIEEALLEIYRQSTLQKLPTNVVADALAEEQLGASTMVC